MRVSHKPQILREKYEEEEKKLKSTLILGKVSLNPIKFTLHFQHLKIFMLFCCSIHAEALLQFGYMVDAVLYLLLFLTDFNGDFLMIFVEGLLGPNFTMLDYTYV